METKVRREDPLWAKLLSLAFAFVILAVLEVSARLILPETLLDRITDVLTQDAVLFWRNRPNMDTRFEGTRIITDSMGLRVGKRAGNEANSKRAGVLRIICLGASPTFGWGVKYEEAYSQQLERLLRGRGIRAEVINAGMIGYTSHQGKLLLEREIAGLEPDLVTVNYVVNDIDKYRFYRTNGKPDITLGPQNANIVWMRNIIDRSRFVRLLEKGIHYIGKGRSAFEGKSVEMFRPGEVRVPVGQYHSNLRDIIQFCSSRGIRVVLVKLPVNLPVARKVDKRQRDDARKHLSRGIRLVNANDCERAVMELRRAAARDPNESEAYYFLGVCYRRMGDSKRTDRAFAKAFRSEAYRCGRDGLIYNREMDLVGKETGTPVADIPAAFRRHKGEYLFISPKTDPIHPNAKGHRIIGREIFKEVMKSISQSEKADDGKIISNVKVQMSNEFKRSNDNYL
ncbi:MAG: GDSL-type esterase/lipase family protein [bacterium]